MFIWIGAASLLLLVVSLVKLHKIIALKLLATYYEAEVLEHNGRECEYRGYYLDESDRHAYKGCETHWWRNSSEEEKARKIRECAKKRALEQSRKWVRTELNAWADRTADRMQERKEA